MLVIDLIGDILNRMPHDSFVRAAQWRLLFPSEDPTDRRAKEPKEDQCVNNDGSMGVR
jgi:hypothetical protein